MRIECQSENTIVSKIETENREPKCLCICRIGIRTCVVSLTYLLTCLLACICLCINITTTKILICNCAAFRLWELRIEKKREKQNWRRNVFPMKWTICHARVPFSRSVGGFISCVYMFSLIFFYFNSVSSWTEWFSW